MKKKPRKTDWSPLNIQRREKLLELLPSHGWSIPAAAEAAGYSPQYAKKRIKDVIKGNVEFCDRIIQLRKETEATSQDDVELVKKTMRQIINDPDSRRPDIVRACDVLCKIAGVYSEKRVIEDDKRQRELNQTEQREATLLAMLRLRLPAPGVTFSLPNIIDAVTQQADIRAGVSRTQPDMALNSTETGGQQGDSSSADTPLQALLTDGQDGAGEGLHPPNSPGASFPCSPR